MNIEKVMDVAVGGLLVTACLGASCVMVMGVATSVKIFLKWWRESK